MNWGLEKEIKSVFSLFVKWSVQQIKEERAESDN